MGGITYQDVIFEPLDSLYLHSHTHTSIFTLRTPKPIDVDRLNNILNPHKIMAHVFWSPRWMKGLNEVFIITLPYKRVFVDIKPIVYNAVKVCMNGL